MPKKMINARIPLRLKISFFVKQNIALSANHATNAFV